jgi:hypothetical protein
VKRIANKVPKSDKAKLSHPLLAQRLRQLYFAPWQRRYVVRRPKRSGNVSN